MEIEFIGKDPGSQINGSPTVYRTDRDSFLVQGWTVSDAAALAKMDIPDGESVVEIPARMLPLFKGLT